MNCKLLSQLRTAILLPLITFLVSCGGDTSTTNTSTNLAPTTITSFENFEVISSTTEFYNMAGANTGAFTSNTRTTSIDGAAATFSLGGSYNYSVLNNTNGNGALLVLYSNSVTFTSGLSSTITPAETNNIVQENIVPARQDYALSFSDAPSGISTSGTFTRVSYFPDGTSATSSGRFQFRIRSTVEE